MSRFCSTRCQFRTISQAKSHANSAPQQAAVGCDALIDQLNQAIEQVEQAGNDQAKALLTLTISVFQVIGLAAQSLDQSGTEGQEKLDRARTLAVQVDEQTDQAYSLEAWITEITDQRG